MRRRLAVSSDLARQIADELDRAAWPLVGLLGGDIIDVVSRRIRDRAPMLAFQLAREDDDQLAGQTAIDLLCALFPSGDPEDRDPGWWRTPLGRACGRSLGTDGTSVSHSVAASMLGIERGSIGKMIGLGVLDRHPDGGVLRTSVLQRIEHLAGRGPGRDD